MIEAFHRAISTGNQNTYKFALGLAILEEYDNEPRIDLFAIARRFAGYYYRNKIIFKIRETNNPDQEPIATLIIRKILSGPSGNGSTPRRIQNSFKNAYARMLLNPPSEIGRSAFTYVLPCWQGAKRNLSGYYDYPSAGGNDFFRYSKDERFIELSPEFMLCIDSHRKTLESLVILEWARFVEKFNQTPNLISKLSTRKPPRRLVKFKSIFLETPQMNAGTCSLCGESLSETDFTQDHIIPFDFIYSDDLWNLVPSHRACNSKKRARIGSEAMITRLNERNRLLWDLDGTSAQKWIKSSAGSIEELEDKILSLVDSAVKAGFVRVDDKEFGG